MAQTKSRPGRWAGFLLLALALFASWRYRQTGALIDQSELSGRLESAVDQVLAANGVRDGDVKKSLRKERRKKWPLPAAWIESERTIVLPPGVRVESIAGNLKPVCEALGFQLRAPPAKDGAAEVLECAKEGQVFQRLLFPPRGAPPGARVAIVIDDIAGRPTDLERLDEFLGLGVPITYAVLPMERGTRAVAEKIHRAGQEIIVHQPMEPEDLAHNNPGKAALLVGMGRAEIQSKLEKNLESVPHAAGISNHMGSRFTGDPRSMQSLADSLKAINSSRRSDPLFFFDSYTNPKSVGSGAASKAGLRHFRNGLFLDHVDELEAMIKQLEVLKNYAKRHGEAAGIGHIQRRHMAEALRLSIPGFRAEGVQFVRVSELMRSKDPVPEVKKRAAPKKAAAGRKKR